MAIVVDSTVGGSSANSYVSLARAAVIAEGLPHGSAWFTDVSINKSQLITHSTTLIDRFFLPDGAKASSSQALLWPQTGMVYANSNTAIPSNVIPLFVEVAVVEWSLYLYENPNPYADIATGIRQLRTPSYEMEFTGGKQPVVPKVVSELLAPYATRQGQTWHRLVRV